MKLYIEGTRDKGNDPRAYINFEYVYNRWKKRGTKAYDWYLKKSDASSVSSHSRENRSYSNQRFR
jgi:hypothetical protein